MIRLGRVFLLLATATLLHAAFSTYEHLSRLKAIGRPEGSLPLDIVCEVLFALVFGIIGASTRASDLREVLWRTEMRNRSLDQMMNSSLTFPVYQKEKPRKEQS